MPTTPKVKTLRITLLSLVVGLVVATLLLSSYVTATLFLDTSSNQLLTNTQQWAKITAERSAIHVSNNEHKLLNKKLSKIRDIKYIHYIHVYKTSPVSNDVHFFTSYNRDQTLPPIQDKIDQISQLAVPKINANGVEYITPITDSSGLIGYVYIQSSNAHIKTLRNNIIVIVLTMLIFILFIATYIVLKTEQLVTSSVNNIIHTVEEVVKQKDYNLQCPTVEIKELDLLSHNINILLSRTRKQIDNLNTDKGQALILNEELAQKVSARTDALKESNQDLLSTLEKLHQFQGQLVESEKMASLGDMVAGVAHEVNTPIGLGVTASTLLADKLNEIKTAFEDKTLRSSQLKKFLDDGQENIDIVFRNLNRAANLISSFKKVSVNQSSEDTSLFNVSELLNEVLLTLAPQLKNTPYNVNIQCPNDLAINSKAGPLNQILINLIFNSIIHGFEGRTNGEIDISVMVLGSQLHIQYQDNGVGMNAEFKPKAFDPFTTTKRGAGGSGLGLHLVYNLVTQALGGTISLESEVNQGVTFDINFPISL